MAGTAVSSGGPYSSRRALRAGAAPPVDALHAARRRRRTRRCRSSSPARAATSTTPTASATSTGSRRSTASTPATAAPSSRRPPRRRCASSTSTRTGATRTRARSSSRRAIAALAPGDLNRVFFTSGGSEAVESALKLARAYHRLTGNAQKTKIIAREVAYHGTTLGALVGDRHHRDPRAVRAARARRLPRAEHQRLPLAGGPRPAVGGRGDRRADRVRGPRDRRRRDPRAGPERRRLHPAAGGLLPARARDLRPLRRAADLRRGDLLVGAHRPLLRLRALRLRAGHHHDRQGPDLGVRPDGRDDRLRPRRRAVPARARGASPTASPSAATRVAAAVALANIELLEREDLCGARARQGGRVPRDARGPARHPDRRRRARRRLLPGDRAGQGPRRPRRPSTTRSPSTCCAASSRARSTTTG